MQKIRQTIPVPSLQERKMMPNEERAMLVRELKKAACSECRGNCCKTWTLFDFYEKRPLLGLLSDGSVREKVRQTFEKKVAGIWGARNEKIVATLMKQETLEELADNRLRNGVWLAYQKLKALILLFGGNERIDCLALADDGCAYGNFKPTYCWNWHCEGEGRNLTRSLREFTAYELLVAHMAKENIGDLTRQLKLMAKFPYLREERLVICEQPLRMKETVENLPSKNKPMRAEIVEGSDAFEVIWIGHPYGFRRNFNGIYVTTPDFLEFAKERFDQGPIRVLVRYEMLVSGKVVQVTS